MFNKGQEPKRLKLRRKNKSGREVYLRRFVETARAPKGRPWTKPSKIREKLEADIVSGRRNRALVALLRFVIKCEGHRNAKGRKNRGNAPLEWAWERYQETGVAHSEEDICAALDSGEIGRWLEKLFSWRHKGRVLSKSEKRTGRRTIVETASGKPISRFLSSKRAKPETEAASDVSARNKAAKLADDAICADTIERARAKARKQIAHQEALAELRRNVAKLTLTRSE